MLRIRPKSAAVTLEDPTSGVDAFRKDYENYFDENKASLPAGYSSHGNDPKVVLVPQVAP